MINSKAVLEEIEILTALRLLRNMLICMKQLGAIMNAALPFCATLHILFLLNNVVKAPLHLILGQWCEAEACAT
jgi:hypothetical protein